MTDFDAQLLIGGRSCPAEGGRTFDRKNPVTGTVVTRAAAASVADADRAVAAADAAFEAWAALGPLSRRMILLRCANALEERMDDIVALGVAETGSTVGWMRANVDRGATLLREAAALTTFVRGEVIPAEKPGCEAIVLRQPRGVVLGIAPWNSPVILSVRAVATPLACGNTVVMKTSEKCPGLHRMVAEALVSGGLPDGVLNVIGHSPEDGAVVTAALIENPAVRHINFTGSTRVGRIIAETAAQNLKPCLLELGGKSPMIVLDDAPLDHAVRAAAFGFLQNQGQICMSTERAVVVQDVADSFVGKLANRARGIRAAPPEEGAPLAAVIDPSVIAPLRGLVEDAEAKGAIRLCGELPDNGAVMQPLILDRVTAQMRIYHEESFGPILAVIRARDTEDAIAVANDSDFGLTASVFGGDVLRALSVARRLRTGMAHVNGPTINDEPQMPFGGTGDSGYGRFGGTAAIHEFTETRWITTQDPAQNYPF